MVAFRGYYPLSMALLLAIYLSAAAAAAAGETGLYDQPVLTLEPGMHTAPIRYADVSATGAYAVSGADDKTVRLWEAPTGRLLRTIRLPQGPGPVGKVYAVAINPDGALVAAGGYTGREDQPQSIYLFDRDTGALVRRLDGVPGTILHLAFSPTGRYLAATLCGTRGLRVYDRDADWREVARDAPYGAASSGAAFAVDGTPRWTRPAPSVVWATNITADGRLVVAAHGDGTLRWQRMADGSELLALFPLADRRNWVAWTPEGVYAATPGAYGVLRWHVNRGWDAPAEAIPVSEIPETHRPEVIRLVLQEMGTPGALAVAELAKIRAAIQRRTGTAVAPGARLHLLTVGVSDYGQAATHLRLAFAAADAHDVAALLTTQTSLYAEVRPQRLSNQDATRAGILRGLATMREAMARGEPGRDLAVVHFSGHGALLDGEFYLLPHDVDVGDAVTIKHTALSASMLRQELEGLGQYGRVLVLLDACRSGGAMATGQALAVDATRLRTVLVRSNITVLTSSDAAELSREDPQWGNGAFTEILLEALSSRADANRNGLISVSELTGYLTRHVPGLTDGAQHPGVEVRFDGDVFVAGL
jgi:hypothetical protein